MFEKRKMRQYQETVQTAIAANSHAVFWALMRLDRTQLDTQVAEFLLQEAGWSIDGFIEMVENGDFDD